MTEDTPAKTVAITGATGLVGRHLCNHFAKGGWTVRALARNSNAYPFSEPGIHVYPCCLPDTIADGALEDADVVIHCAYMTRFTNLTEAKRVNQEGTWRVLELARRMGLQKFVFVSSTSAHEDARSYYGRSKYTLEKSLDPDRDLVIRPGLVLATDGGLFQRMSRMVQHSRLVPVIGGGHQILQTVHIDDLCAAFERVINLGLTGRIVVADREGLTLRRLLQLIAQYQGRRCVTVPVPYWPLLVTFRLSELLRVRLPISSENLMGLISVRAVSTSADLQRVGIRLRSTEESLAALASFGCKSDVQCDGH